MTATDSDSVSGPAATLPVLVQTAQLQGTTLAVGGTPGKDRIILWPADAQGDIQVRVNGRSEGVFHPTGQILVYTQGGDDVVRLASRRIDDQRYSIDVPAILYGGNGNDVLGASGSTAANILMGGAGNDALIGGSGPTILIGGGGSDRLIAGTGDTILIGGTTNFDPSSTTLTPDQQLQALDAILAEWGRTDLSGTRQQTYLERVNDLLGTATGGLNGSFFLNADTVHDDASTDRLSGNRRALDWFFADAGNRDILRGMRLGEVITRLTPQAAQPDA